MPSFKSQRKQQFDICLSLEKFQEHDLMQHEDRPMNRWTDRWTDQPIEKGKTYKAEKAK